jgi:hypothetical protein
LMARIPMAVVDELNRGGVDREECAHRVRGHAGTRV